MIKKNKFKRYALVTQEVFSLILRGKEVVGVMAVIVLWLLNIWLANKLNPLIQNLDSLASKVSASEEKINTNQSDISQMKSDVAFIKGAIMYRWGITPGDIIK